MFVKLELKRNISSKRNTSPLLDIICRNNFNFYFLIRIFSMGLPAFLLILFDQTADEYSFDQTFDWIRRRERVPSFLVKV